MLTICLNWPVSAVFDLKCCLSQHFSFSTFPCLSCIFDSLRLITALFEHCLCIFLFLLSFVSKGTNWHFWCPKRLVLLSQITFWLNYLSVCLITAPFVYSLYLFLYDVPFVSEVIQLWQVAKIECCPSYLLSKLSFNFVFFSYNHFKFQIFFCQFF